MWQFLYSVRAVDLWKIVPIHPLVKDSSIASKFLLDYMHMYDSDLTYILEYRQKDWKKGLLLRKWNSR